jgi:LL-diaminopimelate aminotransferase
LQLAGIAALMGPQQHIIEMRRLYQQRRDALIAGLRSLGWQVEPPRATFYVWIRIPVFGPRAQKTGQSIAFAALLMKKADLVVTPGVGFGRYGEGYIRMALTVTQERIEEAVGRLSKIT